MTHEFEYKIKWYFDDDTEYARTTFVTQVEGDGFDDYEVEEIARDNACAFAEAEEPDLYYEVTLIDAR